MGIKTEEQDQPSSTNPATKTRDEEETAGSSEVSLEDDWAAALAEQNQEKAATTTSSTTDAQAEATTTSPPQTATEEPPVTEASLEDEWAAALAEQSQEEAGGTTTEPIAKSNSTDAQAEATTTSPQNTETEEPPATKAALEDEWAAALAEQSQEEAAATATESIVPSSATNESSVTDAQTESASTSPQSTETEEPPATEAALEDEWAAALAEQSQEEAAATTSSATDAQAEATTTSPPQTATEEPPVTEASLEDEWAAALAEQDQAETAPNPIAPVASDEHTKTLADTHSTALVETPESDLGNNDEDMENDWEDILKESPQAPTADNTAQTEIAAEQETSQEEHNPPSDITANELQALAPNPTTETETPPIEAQDPETPSTDVNAASEDQNQVRGNWPDSNSSKSQPASQPTEWKPTRIGSDSESATNSDSPSPEELLAASTPSSAQENANPPGEGENTQTEPPPELPLAATAAQTSVEAAMAYADDVAAIIQDKQAIEKRGLLDADAKGSKDTPPPSEPPATTAETPTASETQDLDPAPPNPEPPVPDASSPNSGEAPDRFRRPIFSGTGSSLFGMFTMNTLLTLLTFGVYSFWGRIKIRRYLHSQTQFAGARLAFHGTGGELFKGWMKAMAIFGIPYTALNYAGALQTNASYQWGVNIIAGLLILCFIPIAIVGSHRYRMSRTSWRGIYFSFRHSAKDFITLYLKGTLFSILTLGIFYPIFDNAKRGFLSSGTHFGNRAFGFTGEGKELGAIYFKAFRVLVLGLVTAEAVLLTISFLSGKTNPNQVIDIVFWTTIGIVSMVIPFVVGVYFWFQAARQRYMWSHTTFGSARFQATMTGKDLFELRLTNLCLLVFTLGLAWPWVQTRNLQFLYYHVGLQGPLNLKQIVQEASTASPMGEELAGFFDTGFDLG